MESAFFFWHNAVDLLVTAVFHRPSRYENKC
ncbi:hypothetical protein B23_3019 [Geobacillus thermoleovorans B23]|nr:hypothetical protein B23_3019 [Geobacillus thermoleovorans B23]